MKKTAKTLTAYSQPDEYSLRGRNYLYVGGDGTAAENVRELKDTYALAKKISPNKIARSATNRMTIIVGPGVYTFGTTKLVLDAEFIDLVSLTGNTDVMIDGIFITGNNINVKGIDTGTNAFTITGTGVVAEKCKGLDYVSDVDFKPKIKALEDANIAIIARTINVRDFGAVGDGIADDTIAIQAAIDAASVDGKICFLPAGHYKITDTLNITYTIFLNGENSDSVIIDIVSETKKPAIKITGTLASYGKINGGGISQICIQCHRNCDGILIDLKNPYSLHRAIYENIVIKNTLIGFKGISDGGNILYLCTFRNIVIEEYIGICGFWFDGGCYNQFIHLSADSIIKNGRGYKMLQQGATMIDLVTDGIGYFVCEGGILESYSCEAAAAGSEALFGAAALELSGNITLKRVNLFGLPKATYSGAPDWLQISGLESVIMIYENSSINISDVLIGQLNNLVPEYPLMIQNNIDGIIENIKYKDFSNLGINHYKLEQYATAEKLENIKFLNCEIITDISNLASNIVDALPTPSEKLRFSQVALKGAADVADGVYVCMKNASNVYIWVLQ